MTRSLKERYETKRIHVLLERLKVADKNIMSESWNEHDMLILEAFDKQQMAAAIDVVKKLKSIQFGPLKPLAAARDAAVADVTKVLAGGKNQGLIRKIVNLFKSDKENPLVDVLAFSSALYNFFGQFTQYIESLSTGVEGADEKALGALVTGKSDEELSDINAVAGLGADEKKKLADLQKVIMNGLKPSGMLAKIGKNWVDKYMKGRKGLQEFAKSLLRVKVATLKATAESVTSSFQNVEAVGQAAAGAAQQGAVGTTTSTGGDAATSSEPGGGTASTKSGETAPGAQPVGKGGVDVNAVVARIKAPMEDMGVKDVNKLVAQLADLGVLKNPA